MVIPLLLCSLAALLIWAAWLAFMEASAPGWCRRWLQRLDLHTWHGRFDWLASWCLLAAVVSEAPARPWLLLAYLVSAGCRYASRPRPRPVQVYIDLHR